MTNMNPYIEEIEKRFDELVEKRIASLPWSADADDDWKTLVDGNLRGFVHSDEFKAFLRSELPSLLSKFAAEINGEEHKIDKDLFLATPNSWYDKTGWNHHHRSVAEKAEEIIKNITT